MSQPLSPEQVAQLLPLLPELVRLIVPGGHPSTNELEMLLLGSGLDSEPYRAELQRWSSILTAARASTEASRRDLAQRALMMRSVPEADAAQAAEAVTRDTGVPVAAATAASAAAPSRSAAPPWWWIGLGTLLVLLLAVVAIWYLANRQRLANTAVVQPPATVAPVIGPPYPGPPTATRQPTQPAYPAPTAVAVAVAPTQPPTAAPTAAPAATVTRPPAPTRTATPNVSPTPRPPTRTPGPTTTLPASAQACQTRPGLIFGNLWVLPGVFADMGCAIGGPQNVVTAIEEFERGYMFYRQDRGRIYALYNDGTSQVFDDTWRDGDPEYSCPDAGPSKTPPTPRRGIGKIWCTEPGVRDKLGQAKSDEAGYIRPIQEFDRGFMFATGDPPSQPFAIFDNSQHWIKG